MMQIGVNTQLMTVAKVMFSLDIEQTIAKAEQEKNQNGKINLKLSYTAWLLLVALLA